MVDIWLPILTVSEANIRENWRKKSRRAKNQRHAVYFALSGPVMLEKLGMPLRVVLTRQSPRELDGDNLQSAFKAVRDGVADAVGVDDRDARYEWVYRQEMSKTKGIRIVIDQMGSK